MPATLEKELAKHPDLIQQNWLDLHTHLNFLEESPEQAIANAQKLGVKRFVTIGTEPNDLPVVLAIAKKHYPTVCCTLGIHPHEANLFTDEISEFIQREASAKEVVAVGEIGLDYYYKNCEPKTQLESFDQQLALAEKLNLPVEIHTRDAEPDTVELLKKYQGKVRGIIHCFTGTKWLAEKALDLGYNISMSGIVTFKNAKELREVAELVPLDRMHVETDAPFLTPSPFRGVKNSPQYVVFTAQFIADLRGLSVEEFSQQLIRNAKDMFPKLQLDNL